MAAYELPRKWKRPSSSLPGQAVKNIKTAEKAVTKTARKSVKTAEHTSKAAIKTTQQATKTTIAAVKAIIAGTKALIAVIAVVIIIIICLIGLICGPVFGIFFSGEDSGIGQTMQTVVREINTDYDNKLERIKIETPHDVLESQVVVQFGKKCLQFILSKSTPTRIIRRKSPQ